MSEVEYIKSKLFSDIGVPHGWFMRYGGVSVGRYESLNGKKGMADRDESVEENRRRAMSAIVGEDMPYAHIMHNFQTNIHQAVEAGEFQNYDASYTTKKGLTLTQTTADCGTIIIADTKGKIAALVHGSWHTLKAEIICDTVAKLKEHTTEELVAGLGPMACGKCYEFGAEAATLFHKKYLTPHGKKYFVDLKAMAIDQLQSAGIAQIDDTNICTIEDDRFFSARRNGADSGRFLTLVTLP